MSAHDDYKLIMAARETLPAPSHEHIGTHIVWTAPAVNVHIIPPFSEEPLEGDEPKQILFTCIYIHRYGYVWEINRQNF